MAATIPSLLILLTFLFLHSATSNHFHRGHAPFACDPSNPATSTYAFCRADLSTPTRVRDLISRLTLTEKVGLLGDRARSVHRLGIRPYEWWSEALHGVSNVGPGTFFEGKFPAATSFPQVITTVASFNSSLWEAIGRAVSDEARAMYNGGVGGLTYWSPNVNIFRDPRWGRGQETPGEDPVVAATYATSYVRGLQGELSGDRLKVAACCKHYTAYDLDNWGGVDRFHFNAQITEQDRVDTYDVPFQACINQGKVASIMCSYNQVNGIPTCADTNLLTKTIRNEWKLNGYIVSDCDSVKVFFQDQHYTSTPEQAAADAIKAGLDLDCGPFLTAHTTEAVKQGILSETDIDKALSNTLTVQMRLGMFDPVNLYSHLGAQHVCSAEHQVLALDAARQGIVLMKNHGPVLPLSRVVKKYRSVAVIGPNSDATVTMIGNYAGLACKYTSPLQGISAYVDTIRVNHQMGCVDVRCETDELFEPAIKAASEADVTILVMGLDQSIEAEFRDRKDLLLPGKQLQLITAVSAVNGGGKGKVVLVLMSGGPIDITFAKNDPRIGAILWVGYPGQEGGAAIADVIFGTHNPSGKLPMTWYPQEYLSEALPMTAMGMRPDGVTYPGRSYRFYTGPTVYPFGHGLSYTNFEHSVIESESTTNLAIQLDGHRLTNTSSEFGDEFAGKAVRVTHARCGKLSVEIEIEVRNVGKIDGIQTLLVFSTPPKMTREKGWAPRRQLVGFERVFVGAGRKERVRVSIHVCKFLSLVDKNGVRRIPLGRHGIHVEGIKHAVDLHAAGV